MEPSRLDSYAYFLFDDDKTGSLEHDEVKVLVETIQHKTYEKTLAVRKLVDTIMTGRKVVTVENFEKFCKDNPSLCAPLISLQHELRKSFIGTFHISWGLLGEYLYDACRAGILEPS